MEAFSITNENIEVFYPLLPEEFQKQEIDENIVLLGAAQTNDAGENHACATMVISVAGDSLLLINWILVAPEYRNLGAGTAMMELLQDLAKQMNMKVIAVFSQESEANESDLYRFFNKYGFNISERESKEYSVFLSELDKSESLNREQTNQKGIVKLKDVTPRMIAELNKTLAEQGMLLSGPISKEYCISDISIVHVENDSITSCVVFRELGDKTIELSFTYSGKRAPMQMYSLLVHAKHLLCQRYDADTELVIPCVTVVSRKLAEAFIPSARVSLISYIAQWQPEMGEN